MPPGRNVPFPPMEAQLVETLPAGERWQYEPKWDGFRGVLENDGGPLALWSRNERPLLRYFPELAPLGALLPPHSALDGEIVIAADGRLDFDAMQMRLHPAESRIRRLAQETPATFIAFDILLWDGEPLHRLPLERRRTELEARPRGFQLSPVTRDAALARRWLERLEVIGLDGVIAKRLDLAYRPGSRDAVVKVKHHRTVDCVIVGYRSSGARIATLLLGLYRADGALDFVGHTSGIPAALQAELRRTLPPLAGSGQLGGGRMPGGESRWSRGKDLEWTEVRPELVCEVRFDKMEADRFRHGTRFVRFRPDKDPRQCTWDQLSGKRRRADPTLASLLGPPAERGRGARSGSPD
ncbi:MAG: ATP-dependent DNA ligase [Candidatus Limnocylindria bacterium]